MSDSRAAASGPPPFAGDARFEPLGFLGRGAAGCVYRVLDRELQSVVALKTIAVRAAEPIYRLKREFRALAGIVHANLVQLHDLVVSDDVCFFTMELVEGPDFVEYVRGEAGDAEGHLYRFLDAAPQLVRGLAALHGAGRLHRDVKPSNVRVDPRGRVVILDFDLAALLDELGGRDAAAGEVAGTFAYMAPEQTWGLEVGPAADWYALGVVFHEALTGRLPSDGRPAALAREGSAGPIAVPAWEVSLPERLRELVASLLRPEPQRRPGAGAILEALGAMGAAREPARPQRSAPAPLAFVGRTLELSQLRGIFEATGGPRIAGVHGPSGIGKTELVRRLLAELEGEGGAWILSGRCHPQESVPFKALDPIVDALSGHLLAHDLAELAALLPEGAAALARLLPVLARVPALSGAGDEDRLDVVEVRRRGVGALREILARIARARPLVVWIDDAQWSDADSAGLLGELLRPPAAPPLFLLLSYRSEDRDGVELLRIVRELAREFSSLRFEELKLAPLDPEESLDLARRLCPAALAPGAEVEALIAEAGGSPFFLAELTWYLRARAGTGSAMAGLRLGDVISGRLADLLEPERRVLELVSLCGRPTERSLVLEAAGLGERGRPLVQRLEGLGFVRTAAAGERARVETYHDRIRETVSDRLSSVELVQRHRALAVTFEASGRVEADILAHHFHGAGELPRAADHALSAADRASGALAFLRAAELYRAAREWDPRGAERDRTLLTREADALAKAGRLVEGGRLFQRAALGAPRLEALELRRRAAEHLVSGGELDEGLAALEALLADLGLRFPRTPRRALLAAGARLLALAARGIDVAPAATALDEEERIRIDTCYGAAKNLVDSDALRGIYFSIRSLERALRAREAQRLARSLSVVGGSLSVVGGPLLARLGERMMRRADGIAAELASPELWGTIDVSRGEVLMLAGHCRQAVERCDAGVRRLSQECQGYVLESNVGRAMALRALEELGRMAEMEVRARELRDAAAAVGNRYAETQGSQFIAIARIACGDVAGAREMARHQLAHWSRRGFHIQHFYAERILVLCDLYEGRPEQGWERLRAAEPELRGSGLLRIPLTRTDYLSLRAQLALACAFEDPAGRSARLRAGTRAVRRLERERRADAALHAQLVRAGMASLLGDAPAAVALLDRAIEMGEAGDMALRAACARLRRAEVLDDDAALEAARAEMRACGVASPERWAAIYAPGFAASGQGEPRAEAEVRLRA